MYEANFDAVRHIGTRPTLGVAMAIMLSLPAAASGVEPLAEILIGKKEAIVFGMFNDMSGTPSLSPDGTLLAAGVWTRTGPVIKLWDARLGRSRDSCGGENPGNHLHDRSQEC